GEEQAPDGAAPLGGPERRGHLGAEPQETEHERKQRRGPQGQGQVADHQPRRQHELERDEETEDRGCVGGPPGPPGPRVGSLGGPPRPDKMYVDEGHPGPIVWGVEAGAGTVPTEVVCLGGTWRLRRWLIRLSKPNTAARLAR